MKTMNRWFLAGLIGLSSAAVSMAAPVILDSFTVSQNIQTGVDPFDEGAGVDAIMSDDGNGIGGTLDAGVNDLNDVTANTGVRRVFHTSLGSLAGATINGGGSLNFSLVNGQGFFVEWVFANPITIGVGDSVVLAGSGSISRDPNSTGFVINALQGYNPEDGTRTLISGQDSYYFWPNSGALSDIVFTYADVQGWGMNDIPLNALSLWFYVGHTGDTLSFTASELVFNDETPMGVPEPETVWMIVAVLASLAVTFRRQLLDLAGRFVKT